MSNREIRALQADLAATLARYYISKGYAYSAGYYARKAAHYALEAM